MPPRVPEPDFREFSPAEKMFICNQKMSGVKYPVIRDLFTEKFGKNPPSRVGVWKMMMKMKNKFTMLDMRKGNSGRKVSVRSPGLIAAVKRSLNRAASRAPGQQGPSARRNGLGIKKSTYNYITKHDLKLKP